MSDSGYFYDDDDLNLHQYDQNLFLSPHMRCSIQAHHHLRTHNNDYHDEDNDYHHHHHLHLDLSQNQYLHHPFHPIAHMKFTVSVYPIKDISTLLSVSISIFHQKYINLIVRVCNLVLAGCVPDIPG